MERIKLSHGNGKELKELIDNIIVPILYDKKEDRLKLEDAFLIDSLDLQDNKLAFTTDSFVIDPIEFRGGDIGKLAICGTINDLAMMGAIPKYISLALILEEGLEIDVLKRILTSIKKIADASKVKIVTGDTKVVEKGKGDKVYINTTGIGVVSKNINISISNAKPGDKVIINGYIGQHGIAILTQREDLSIASECYSDCNYLSDIIQYLLSECPYIKVLRDPTRGGCASILNEIALESQVTIEIEEEKLPIDDTVKGACSYLGIDPLYVANEGKFIAIVDNKYAKKTLSILKKHPLGKNSAIIGEVKTKQSFPVYLKTIIGGKRIIEYPPGELLPRIC